ncbi:conserved hypothetical protein [Ricinus communis]|uniref:Uncharacterized protein n=1 Tax=Ricinus communis TaxID=3988 RepID=B9TI94_RICCO|nr:conserved hypothetical protein [Ricinus communis]
MACNRLRRAWRREQFRPPTIATATQFAEQTRAAIQPQGNGILETAAEFVRLEKTEIVRLPGSAPWIA